MKFTYEHEIDSLRSRVAELEAERDRLTVALDSWTRVAKSGNKRIAELEAERDRLATALTEFYDRRTTGYERDQAFVEAEAALKEWENKRTP
jgi:exonuclease VII small subunit